MLAPRFRRNSQLKLEVPSTQTNGRKAGPRKSLQQIILLRVLCRHPFLQFTSHGPLHLTLKIKKVENKTTTSSCHLNMSYNTAVLNSCGRSCSQTVLVTAEGAGMLHSTGGKQIKEQ